MESLVSAGAAGSSEKGLFFHDDEPGLLELVSKQLVYRMNNIMEDQQGGWYTLSPGARSSVALGTHLTAPQSLLQYTRKVPLENSSAVELIVSLAGKGWKDQATDRPKSVVPYQAGAKKIWWTKPGKSLSLFYLRSLASVDNILCHEQQQLHHFQSKAYYDALLSGCKGVLPNQPLRYYQQIMKGKKVRKGKQQPEMKKLRAEQQCELQDELSNLDKPSACCL